MAILDPTEAKYDRSNAKVHVDEYSFCKEEKEMHVWYDEISNRTEVETTIGPWISKLQRNPRFVATHIQEKENGFVTWLRGYLEGDKTTIRTT